MTNTGSSIIITIIFMSSKPLAVSGVLSEMESLRRAELMEAACSSSHLRLIELLKPLIKCSRGANAPAVISLRGKRPHPHVDSWNTSV